LSYRELEARALDILQSWDSLPPSDECIFIYSHISLYFISLRESTFLVIEETPFSFAGRWLEIRIFPLLHWHYWQIYIIWLPGFREPSYRIFSLVLFSSVALPIRLALSITFTRYFYISIHYRIFSFFSVFRFTSFHIICRASSFLHLFICLFISSPLFIAYIFSFHFLVRSVHLLEIFSFTPFSFSFFGFVSPSLLSSLTLMVISLLHSFSFSALNIAAIRYFFASEYRRHHARSYSFNTDEFHGITREVYFSAILRLSLRLVIYLHREFFSWMPLYWILYAIIGIFLHLLPRGIEELFTIYRLIADSLLQRGNFHIFHYGGILTYFFLSLGQNTFSSPFFYHIYFIFLLQLTL